MTLTKHPPRIDVNDQFDARFEQPFDLARYIVLVLRWLPGILGCALACAAIGAFVTLSRPTEYDATSTLAVSGSKIAEQASSVAAVNYRPLIENNSVAATVITEFRLDQAPFHLTPEMFRGSVLTVEEVRNSSLIRLHITLGDPVRAADVANRVSDLAIEGARKLSQAEAVQARDDLRAAVDDARKQMDNAAARLQAFKSTAQVELTRADVKTMLEQRGLLLPLALDIEAARARVARGEAELAGRQRVDSFVKTIDSEPALGEAARSAGDSVLGLQVKSQEANKVYEAIEERLVRDRADVAAMEQRRSQLIRVRGLDRQQQSMLTALYRKESELARLNAEYEVAEKSYKDIAARYDVAKVQIAGRSGQIQVIDRAIVPSVGKPRHVRKNTLFGFLAGGLLAIVGLVLTTAVRDTLKRARAA